MSEYIDREYDYDYDWFYCDKCDEYYYLPETETVCHFCGADLKPEHE